MNNSRKKILIIIDVENWIFHKHALFLKEHLKDLFDIDIQTQNLFIDESYWDLIYPLEWNLSLNIENRDKSKWVTGIRSLISWNKVDRKLFKQYLNQNFKSVHVVSEEILFELSGIHSSLICLTHGVDTELFQRSKPYRVCSDTFKIGWAGNKINPNKGFDKFVSPLGNISGCELIHYSYAENQIGPSEMVKFYESIDVFICASESEGNSNTLLEAAAMGLPIITTNVGTVPEYLIHEESALIVNRELIDFVDSVCRLKSDFDLCYKLSEGAKIAVGKFDWKLKLDEHKRFFLNNINN